MENDYKCVLSVAGIREYLGSSNVVAFDFETAPDEKYREEVKAALDAHKAHIVGCSFSAREGSGIYVPLCHRLGKNVDRDDFHDFLRDFLSDDKVTKVAHNIAFEAQMSYALGMVIQPPMYDTICAAQLSLKSDFEFRKLADSGLKKLAAELFGEALPGFNTVTEGRHFDELDAQDPETVRYGAADSDYALRLYNRFNRWFDASLPRHRWIVENLESPTAVYLGLMKYNGIPLDTALMEQKKAQAEREMARLRAAIRFIIGDVDIGMNCATKAFKNYLYSELGLPVFKTTETYTAAADDAALVMLKEWCAVERPELTELFSLVQEYRKWNKVKATYIDGYLKYLNTATGRMHPDFFALSTDTGRMSCRNPNAQNMPRKTGDPVGVRSFIKAPAGQLIMSLDFSQIELRIGAFFCRDAVMLDTYRSGGDIHAATTSVVFGVSDSEARNKHREEYKEQRTIAKNVNFGTFYGLFPAGLQKTLKFKAGVDRSLAECEEIIANLKAGYKGLSTWQEETKAAAARRLYSDTWFGRRRFLPGLRSGNWGVKSFAERCALNTPIQGTAADVLKLAVCRILAGLPQRPWLRPIMQIHDELTFIVPTEKLEDAVRFVKSCMEAQPFPEFDLPLMAEAAAGESFGNMEELYNV